MAVLARWTRLLATLAQLEEVWQADYPDHPGRPGEVGGSLPKGQSVNAIEPDEGGDGGGDGGGSGPVFRGAPVAVQAQISKQATGSIGERVAQLWLERAYGGSAAPANVAKNNFPVDVVHGDTVIEVKTGLVSNGADAQKWRLTIGQPGKAETAWLKTASATDKEAWNQHKQDQIEVRKATIIKTMSGHLGKPVKSKTIGIILNPDTKRADVYEFEGFHPIIRWKSKAAKKAYRGTVRYH